MKQVTFMVPDDMATVRIDVSVHFGDDLAACEAFSKLAAELEEPVTLSYSRDRVMVETEIEGILAERCEVTYYGPSIRDQREEHKPRDLLHARMAQLKASEADERAKDRRLGQHAS